MNIIVCLDENKGILFNKRRVSKDKEIILDIVKNNDCIYVSEYSYKLFLEYGYSEKVIIKDICNEGTFFIEDSDVSGCNIEKITIYYFNRKYPSDYKFNIDLSKYKKVLEEEFIGSSHEKITKCIYEV